MYCQRAQIEGFAASLRHINFAKKTETRMGHSAAVPGRIAISLGTNDPSLVKDDTVPSPEHKARTTLHPEPCCVAVFVSRLQAALFLMSFGWVFCLFQHGRG